MKLNDLIFYLTPELNTFSKQERDDLFDIARKGKFSINEIVVVVVWFELIFLSAQKILDKPLLADGLTLISLSEALLMIPFMCIIFFPIYIKKMRRIIKNQIIIISNANEANKLTNSD